MIDMGRVANNGLTLLVIAAFFYFIYLKMKGQQFGGLNRLKGLFNRGKE